MTDTPQVVRDRYREMLMARSGAERLAMECRMFDTARVLMRAGLRDTARADESAHPRAQLFLRTYGRDFDDATSARIIAHLRGRVEEITAEGTERVR
jgi:hypothetical protein